MNHFLMIFSVIPFTSIVEAASGNFYCELTVRKFLSPRINGTQIWVEVSDTCQLVSLGCHNSTTGFVDDDPFDERCWTKIIPRRKLQQLRQQFDMQIQNMGECGKAIFLFNPDAEIMVEKFGSQKPGENIVWYDKMWEYNGRYRKRSTEDGINISGYFSGVRMRMKITKNTESELSLTGAFGSLISKGNCVKR